MTRLLCHDCSGVFEIKGRISYSKLYDCPHCGRALTVDEKIERDCFGDKPADYKTVGFNDWEDEDDY